jgi:RluA family pseudouridine synthase
MVMRRLSSEALLFLVMFQVSSSFSIWSKTELFLRTTQRHRHVCRPLVSAFLGATDHHHSISLKDPRQFNQYRYANSRRLLSNTAIKNTRQSDEDTDDADDSVLENLIPGSTPGFYVIKQYKTLPGEFDLDRIKMHEDFQRLELTPHNISVPAALMLLDPDEFPSRSRARKACRKANIMIHRGPLQVHKETGQEVFDPNKCERARVGDRVFAGDVIAKQVRMGPGSFPILNHKRPPFELPVIYEDDYFAVVNKPEGVVVYAHKSGGHGINTVRAALPFAVKPPKIGTYSTLRRPQPVHRLDKPTSGLLLVAKTKPAMVNLSHQFRDRKVKKTYTALVNGIPDEPPETSITSEEAHDMGVDVDRNNSFQWQLINDPLDEKSAVTIWRPLRNLKSLKANQNYFTMVELKPKSGRYHQLRRHMANIKECPLIGDKTYDGGGTAIKLRNQGLFLCSNSVVLEHPFYNSNEGRKVFENLSEEKKRGLKVSQDGTILVSASIPIPEKFESFMKEEERQHDVDDSKH